MRILYDTNVLVSMLSRRESILAFKRLLELEETVHLSSAHILGEVEAVLADKIRLTRQKAKVAARLLERQSLMVHPVRIEKVCRGPFDDYVLAAAVSGEAEYLITVDKDLLVLERHRQVVIITPVEFTAIMDSSSRSHKYCKSEK